MQKKQSKAAKKKQLIYDTKHAAVAARGGERGEAAACDCVCVCRQKVAYTQCFCVQPNPITYLDFMVIPNKRAGSCRCSARRQQRDALPSPTLLPCYSSLLSAILLSLCVCVCVSFCILHLTCHCVYAKKKKRESKSIRA